MSARIAGTTRVSPLALAMFAAFGLLASLAGCKSTSERGLVDTERRHFNAKCQRTGECVLTQTSGEKRQGGKTALSLLRLGRLVGICDVVPGQKPETAA